MAKTGLQKLKQKVQKAEKLTKTVTKRVPLDAEVFVFDPKNVPASIGVISSVLEPYGFTVCENVQGSQGQTLVNEFCDRLKREFEPLDQNKVLYEILLIIAQDRKQDLENCEIAHKNTNRAVNESHSAMEQFQALINGGLAGNAAKNIFQ